MSQVIYVLVLVISFLLVNLLGSCKSTNPPGVISSLKKITLTSNSVVVGQLEKLQIMSDIEKTGNPNVALIWSSSNDAIATVNDVGLVKGIYEGMVTITAESVLDPEVKAHIDLTVIVVPRIINIFLFRKQLDLEIGRFVSRANGDFTVQINSQGDVSEELRWESDNLNIATVTQEGRIDALAAGVVTIKIISVFDPKKYTYFEVTVLPKPGIDTIVIDQSVTTVEKDKSLTLVYEVRLEGGIVSKEILWSSSDDEIARVDEQGIVYAVALGNVTIIATSVFDRNKSSMIQLEVIPTVRLLSVSFSYATTSVLVGEKITLYVEFEKQSTPDLTLNVASNDSDKVSLRLYDSDSIVVTGVSVGSVTITAKSVYDPTRMVELIVDVLPQPAVISLSFTQDTVTVLNGEEFQTNVNLLTEGSPDNLFISYVSSDETVAIVGLNTGLLNIYLLPSGVLADTTWIVATSDFDENKIDSLLVIVIPVPPTPLIFSVSLSISNVLLVGDSIMATPVISVQGMVNQDVTWSSSNENIATVTSEGLIKALAKGTVEIRVASVFDDSKYTVESIVVRDRPAVLSVRIDNKVDKLIIGQSLSLVASIDVKGGASALLRWTSSDNNVIAVDNNGIITALAAEGQSTIRVTALYDNTQFDSFVVVAKNIPRIVSLVINDDIEFARIEIGETLSLTVEIDAIFEADPTYTWSSMTGNATVSQAGLVTANRLGADILRVTSNFDATKFLEVYVTVIPQIQSLLFYTPLLVQGRPFDDAPVSNLNSEKDDLLPSNWKTSRNDVSRLAVNGVEDVIVDFQFDGIQNVDGILLNVEVDVLASRPTSIELLFKESSSETYTSIGVYDLNSYGVTIVPGFIPISFPTKMTEAVRLKVLQPSGGRIEILETAIFSLSLPSITSVQIDGYDDELIQLEEEIALIGTVLSNSKGVFNNGVSWISSNSNIISVSDGLIRGVTAGIATITATSIAEPSISDAITLTVITPSVVVYSVLVDTLLSFWDDTLNLNSYVSSMQSDLLRWSTGSSNDFITNGMFVVENSSITCGAVDVRLSSAYDSTVSDTIVIKTPCIDFDASNIANITVSNDTVTNWRSSVGDYNIVSANGLLRYEAETKSVGSDASTGAGNVRSTDVALVSDEFTMFVKINTLGHGYRTKLIKMTTSGTREKQWTLGTQLAHSAGDSYFTVKNDYIEAEAGGQGERFAFPLRTGINYLLALQVTRDSLTIFSMSENSSTIFTAVDLGKSNTDFTGIAINGLEIFQYAYDTKYQKISIFDGVTSVERTKEMMRFIFNDTIKYPRKVIP